MRDHEHRLTVLETIIRGTVKDGKRVDGMYDTQHRHHVWLVGDEEAGVVGVVQQMGKVMRLIQIGIGVGISVEIAWVVMWAVLNYK